MRDRGTGMSDLVVTSRPVLMQILSDVEPFVVFKRKQVTKALEILKRIRRGLDPREFLELARHVDAFSTLNHSNTKRIFAADVERHLYGMGVLAPVTTSPKFASRRDGDSDRTNGQSMSSITRRPLEKGWRYSLCPQRWGSHMRETVRSLSTAGVGGLRGAVHSTRGPGRTHLSCASCSAKSMAGWRCAEEITAESI